MFLEVENSVNSFAGSNVEESHTVLSQAVKDHRLPHY
jgi:hypothetical protein